MMKSTILMTSVAVAALTSPAFALPDRDETGCSMSNAICAQEQLRADDGNRVAERTNKSTESGSGTSVGTTANAAAASDEDSLNDEAGDTADNFAHDANEAGDSIANAADEAGDSISHAADEAGGAISDAFN